MSDINMFLENNKPDGYIEMWRGFYIATKKKPNLFHRMMLRIVFGFKWVKDVAA